MPEESARRKYVKLYLKLFNDWEGRLPESARHDLAAKAARGTHKLPAAEQREVDAWLDKKFPGRGSKPEAPKGPGLFDEVMRVD
jgi:hypothetical protein